MDIDMDAEAGPSRPRMHTYPSKPYNRPLSGGGNHRRPKAPNHTRIKHLQPSVEGDSTPTSSSSKVRNSKGPKGPPPKGRKRMTRAQARARGSSSPTTDLEAIALEDAAVKSEIHRLGLGLRDVQGDGNCLFRALADQLWGVARRHGEVRKLVCDYLETNREGMEAFVAPFLREGEGYEGYVDRMRQLTQFGSHIEIQAAARVFRRSIRVIMSTTSFTIPWQTESTSRQPPLPSPPLDDADYFATPRPRTRSSTNNLLSTPALPPPSSPSYAKTLAEYIPSIRPGRSMLWLSLFSQAEHFQSVRRKGDGDSGPAEIEDRLAVPHQKDTSEAARRERGELGVSDSGQAAAGPGDGTKVSQVLASLPAGHGVSEQRASGILARVKGDLGEAVELLLDELRLEGSDEPEHDTSSRSTESSPADQSSEPTTPSDGRNQVKPDAPSTPITRSAPHRTNRERGENRGSRGRVRAGRPVAVAVV